MFLTSSALKRLVGVLLFCVLGQNGTLAQGTSVRSPEIGFRDAVHRLLDTSILSLLTNASSDEGCGKDAAVVLDAARRLELWALKVADASAKIPSGLLQGNVNQFGDIDECLSINGLETSPEVTVTSKYCLAAVDLRNIPVPEIGKLIRSLEPFRSNLSDPGHRVPRMSAALVGLCIPKSCDTNNIESALRSSITSLSLSVRVDTDLCRDKENDRVDTPFWFASAFFALVLITSTCSTIADVYFPYLSKRTKFLEALMAFSIRQNWRKLISTETSHGDIACLHGIRAIHVMALLLSHKSVAILFNPYTNRTHLAKIIGGAWSILGRAAILYTDTFIFLSGLLTAQSILRELKRSGRIQLVKRIVTRYMRLTPVLLTLILWCTLVLPKLGYGPLWGLVVERHAELCKTFWWRNLIYIHNFFGFENMCLTHTHQLGIDMQLFILAPALVIPLWYYPKAGLLLMASLAGASTLLRYTVTLNNSLSSLVYFGVNVSQMFDTARLSYTLPTHRATAYIIGLIAGWVLWRLPHTYKLPLSLSIFGWSLFGMLGVHTLLGSYEIASPDFIYDNIKAANFAALSPITWCAFLFWGVTACVHGSGGFLNDLLSWRGFVVITRLAYSVYLTQFPVFFYNIGLTKHPITYGLTDLLNIPEFACIFFVSGLLTLLIELPFQEINYIIFRNRGIKKHGSITSS